MPTDVGTPAYSDTNGTGATTSMPTTVHTVVSAANSIVEILAAMDNAPDLSGSMTVSYGGVTATLQGKSIASTQSCYRFWVANPTVGPHNVDIAWTGDYGGVMTVNQISDVHQTTPVRGSVVSAGNAGSANPTFGVTSAVGDQARALVSINNDDSITDGAGQTRVAENLNGGNGITGAVVNTKAGAAGTVTFAWTAANQRWGGLAWSLQPPGASAPVVSTPSPADGSTVGTAPTLGALTDTPTGTARIVIDSSTNLSTVTNVQVLAGQNKNGTAAAYASSVQTLSGTSISRAFSGLTPGAYTVAIAQSGGSNVLKFGITVAQLGVLTQPLEFGGVPVGAQTGVEYRIFAGHAHNGALLVSNNNGTIGSDSIFKLPSSAIGALDDNVTLVLYFGADDDNRSIVAKTKVSYVS